MAHHTDAPIHKRLEALYHQSPSHSLFKTFGDFFGQIGIALWSELTRDRQTPRISKFYDIDGKAFWYVFDPITRQRFTYASELEVHEWLEHRNSVQEHTR
jgi:hypothetical protein